MWTAITPKVYGGYTAGRKFLRWQSYLSSGWNSLSNGWGVFWYQQPTRKFQVLYYPAGVLCVFGMPLLYGMLWDNLLPEIVVVPKTGINSGRTPLPAAEVHVPPTVHINYLRHEVYKQAFYFIFGYVSWCEAYDKQLQETLFGELHSLLDQLPRWVDEIFFGQVLTKIHEC